MRRRFYQEQYSNFYGFSIGGRINTHTAVGFVRRDEFYHFFDRSQPITYDRTLTLVPPRDSAGEFYDRLLQNACILDETPDINHYNEFAANLAAILRGQSPDWQLYKVEITQDVEVVFDYQHKHTGETQEYMVSPNGSFLRFGLEFSPSSLGSITRYLVTIYGNKGNFFDFYEDLGSTYRYVRLDRENDEYFFRVEEICGL